jgi:membrane-associated phospholipid phosphatase
MPQEIYGAFDTNPVAAMPSLHAAFPTACALVGWRAYGKRIGAVLFLYAGSMMVSVVYLGEHYGVDVLAGILTATFSAWAARRQSPLFQRPAAAVSFSFAAIVATILVLIVSGR